MANIRKFLINLQYQLKKSIFTTQKTLKNMKIGSKLKGLRVEKGYTTVAMAEILGISDPNL